MMRRLNILQLQHIHLEISIYHHPHKQLCTEAAKVGQCTSPNNGEFWVFFSDESKLCLNFKLFNEIFLQLSLYTPRPLQTGFKATVNEKNNLLSILFEMNDQSFHSCYIFFTFCMSYRNEKVNA